MAVGVFCPNDAADPLPPPVLFDLLIYAKYTILFSINFFHNLKTSATSTNVHKSNTKAIYAGPKEKR